MASLEHRLRANYWIALAIEEINEDVDEIWPYLDGLTQKRVMKWVHGECSLATSMTSIEEVEAELIADTRELQAIYRRELERQNDK